MTDLYVIWILFAISDGIEEAKIFEWKGQHVEWPKELHNYFTYQRIVVGAALIFLAFQRGFAGIELIGFGFSLMAAFPFWHDGSYYQKRRMLDVPHYHFFSQSTTTNAVFSANAWVRSVLFLISLIIQIWLL